MKNLLLILLISVLSASCMTIKRVKKNCDIFMAVCEVPVKVETEILTNTVTEIEYRDTSFLYPIPERIVKEKKPVTVVQKKVNSELSILSVPFAISYAQVIDSELSHELIQSDTLILIKLQNALKVVKTQEKQIETLKEKYVVTLYENKPFAKFTIKWFIGSVVLLLIFLTLAFFKYKNKILGIMK